MMKRLGADAGSVHYPDIGKIDYLGKNLHICILLWWGLLGFANLRDSALQRKLPSVWFA
jgi:hypothetical protein